MNQIPLVASLTNVSIDNPTGPVLQNICLQQIFTYTDES